MLVSIIGIFILIWILRGIFMFITGNDDVIANQKKILDRLGNKEIESANLFREQKEQREREAEEAKQREEKERIRKEVEEFEKEQREEKEKHMKECGNIEEYTVGAIMVSNIITIFLYFTNFIWLGDYLNDVLTFLIISAVYVIPTKIAHKRAKKFVEEEGIVIEDDKFFDYFFIVGIGAGFWATVIMAVPVLILMWIF
jgi:hypothetical protein